MTHAIIIEFYIDKRRNYLNYYQKYLSMEELDYLKERGFNE